MKRLYSFKFPKEIEVEKQEKSTNAAGEEITIVKKVKEIKYDTYFLAKPTRALKEAAEIFYASIVSKCVSHGILTVSLTQKRVLNDGGVLSDEQKKTYEGLYNTLFEKQSEHRTLTSKSDLTDEEKIRATGVFEEMVEAMTAIQNVEKQTGNNLYQNTAENIARNRCNMWWALNLCYKDDNGKDIPCFNGKTYEEKLSFYDNIEEKGSEEEINLLNRLFLITSLWYISGAQKEEDFDLMLKMAENQNVIDKFSHVNEEDNSTKAEQE